MKTLILLGPLLSATISQAATQNLYCSSGMNSLSAEVTTQGAESISIANARILGAFIRADLNCTRASHLVDIKCAGYLNEKILIETSFEQIEGQALLLSYQSPTHPSVTSTKPWTCNFE